MDYPSASTYALLRNFDEKSDDKNVDKFLKNVYQYYATKGLGAVILTQFCAVVSLSFTIIFSAFLIAFVNWNILSDCHDESTCEALQDSIIINPFRSSSIGFCFMIVLYFLLFGTFWIYRCFSAVHSISDAIEIAKFYRDQLGLKESDLQDLQWYEVIERLIKLHNSKILHLVPSPTLTVHEIALRIMRKDNYLIGMINKNCLDLSVPWFMDSFLPGRLFLTKSLEWSLSFCILEYMFDDTPLPPVQSSLTNNLSSQQQQHNEQLQQQQHYTPDQPEISQYFLSDVNGLKWRFQALGLMHFMLLPFMLAFMTVHFFLQNAQQFHSNRAYLGPRQWSPLALWQFREFNELPHLFEDRMNRSYGPTNEYLSTFRNPYISILARLTAYICGAIMATLLLVSLVSEGMLLYVQYGEHNLLWYLGIFSAMFAGARAFIPDETKSVLSAEELLKKVSAHTHYFPDHWHGAKAAGSLLVRDEVSELFQYKAQLFLMEVLSVVLTPVVLCFSLPDSAPRIVDFVREHSRFVPGVGAVCDYSLFEFERYGDERYGSVTQQTTTTNGNGNAGGVGMDSVNNGVGSMQQPHPQSTLRVDKLQDGKLEKSFISFRAAHPNYEGNAGGLSMCNRLRTFKDINYQHREDMLASQLEQSMMMSTQNNVQYRTQYVPHFAGRGDKMSSNLSPPDMYRNTSNTASDNSVNLYGNHSIRVDSPSILGDDRHHHHEDNHIDNNRLTERRHGLKHSSSCDTDPMLHDSEMPHSPILRQGSLGDMSLPTTDIGPSVPSLRRYESDEISPFAIPTDVARIDVSLPMPPVHVGCSDSSTAGIALSVITPSTSGKQNMKSENATLQHQVQLQPVPRYPSPPLPLRTTSSDSCVSNDEVSHATMMHGGDSTQMPYMTGAVNSQSTAGFCLPHNQRGTQSHMFSPPPRYESRSSFLSHVPHHASRSLLYDSRSQGGLQQSNFYAGSTTSGGSRTDMPSVLMSVLRAENIDYENDIYWLNQFHHEKLHNPQQLDQSMNMRQQQQQHMQQQSYYNNMHSQGIPHHQHQHHQQLRPRGVQRSVSGSNNRQHLLYSPAIPQASRSNSATSLNQDSMFGGIDIDNNNNASFFQNSTVVGTNHGEGGRGFAINTDSGYPSHHDTNNGIEMGFMSPPPPRGHGHGGPGQYYGMQPPHSPVVSRNIIGTTAGVGMSGGRNNGRGGVVPRRAFPMTKLSESDQEEADV